MNPRPHVCSGSVFRAKPSVTVQGDLDLGHLFIHNAHARVTMAEPVVAMAEAEYERQYSNQTADRLRERGGLSIEEVVHLLAEAVVRYAPPGELTPRSRQPK